MSAFFNVYVLLHIFCLNGLVHTSGLDNPPSAEDIINLKCTYLYGALTQMKVTKVELTCGKIDLNKVMTSIALYNDIAQRQISTFYDHDPDNVGALWLLHIYTSLMIPLVSETNQKIKLIKHSNEYNTILQLHTFIIGKLETDAANCNVLNPFYMDAKHFTNVPIESLISLEMENKKKMRKFFFSNQQFPIHRVDRFKRINIFLRNLISRDADRKHYKDTYDVQVLWGDRIDVKMENVYKTVNSLDWTSDNLRPVKEFYQVIFSFFKIIMFRLTWKHFFYLQYQNIENFVRFAKDWLEILQEYSDSVGYEKDVHVDRIITSVTNFIAKFSASDKDDFEYYYRDYYKQLESELQVLLTTLCEPLGCAIQPLTLFGNGLPGYEDRPAHDPLDPKTVEYYSLLFARKFLRDIKHRTCSYFHVLRSFIKYVHTLS